MHCVLGAERLTLRRFTEADVDNLVDLNSDPEVMRYLTGGKATPREQVWDDIIPFHLAVYGRSAEGVGTFAAQSRASREFLGWFHLRPGHGEGLELGHRLRRAAWNHGYATEGSRAQVRTYPYEGPGPIDGSEHGAVEYALTRAEWALRSAGA